MSASKATFLPWEEEDDIPVHELFSWDLPGHTVRHATPITKRTLCSPEARSNGPTISALRFYKAL